MHRGITGILQQAFIDWTSIIWAQLVTTSIIFIFYYSCQFFDFCEYFQLPFQGLQYLFLCKSNLFAIRCYSCQSCDKLSGCFFGAMKFLVTFAIFVDLNTRFLQAISIKSLFFLKVRQTFEAKFCYSLESLLNLLFQLHLLFVLYISDSSFHFFLPKLPKEFATKIWRQCSILNISGEPQDSRYTTLSTILMKQKLIQQLGKCGLNKMFWW